MIQHYIESFRLRTLPLALANTLMGSALAYSDGRFSWTIFVLAASTTLLLQILSNMANDYGDFKNGKDTTERIGPRRMVQAGMIRPTAMLKAIVVVVVLTLASGSWLIIEAFSAFNAAASLPSIIIFGILGIAAIAAAINYTMGKNPYGYKAMGDIFVFIFFGLVGVLGTYYLHTGSLRWSLLLPAASIGVLSVGVLNLNNLRDYDQDKKTGKRTMVVVLGLDHARLYHMALLLDAFLMASVYTLLNYNCHWQWFFLAAFPLAFRNLRTVQTFSEHRELYPELKRLSMASLLFALLFASGLIIC